MIRRTLETLAGLALLALAGSMGWLLTTTEDDRGRPMTDNKPMTTERLSHLRDDIGWRVDKIEACDAGELLRAHDFHAKRAHDFASRVLVAEATLVEANAQRDDARRSQIRSLFGSSDTAQVCGAGVTMLARTHEQVAELWGWGYLYPEPKRTGIVEAFAKLREACGGSYDGVDADAHVRELRGHDEDPS